MEKRRVACFFSVAFDKAYKKFVKIIIVNMA